MGRKTTKSSVGLNKRSTQGEDTLKTFPLKAPKLNPTTTISYIQILGNGMDTQDTSPSVLLFFDKQRIIFNAGEGFQRYCREHKIKLSKIDHIFHSRVCSETVGGLPGLLLTLASEGEKGTSVKIWGPSELKYLIDAMLSFIPNDVVHASYFGPESMGNFTDPIDLIDDEVVRISAIIIRPSCHIVSQHNEDSTKSVPSSVDSNEEIKQPLEFLVPHSNNPKMNDPLLKLGDISVIYLCELREIKGKLDEAKAMALGLKKGPKYGELKLGNSVKSDEQNITIDPSDVLGPSIPGPIVLIVDCPTLYHLQELLSIQSLSRYYSDSVDQHLDGAQSVDCIIHLSPSSLTTTVTYKQWMKRFGAAQHIMASHEIKNMDIPILRGSARIAARLNYLCPQFFPSSGFRSPQHHNDSIPDFNCSSEGRVPKLCDNIRAENLLKFHLRPFAHLGLDRSEIPSLLSQKEIINELISEIPEIVDYREEVSQLWDISNSGEEGALDLQSANHINEDMHECPVPSCLENITREDMEIVFLGTGSSQPNKYRNVSSIYLNLFSKGGLLLDSGEATLAQLIKRYGESSTNAAVGSLRCIWISHIHADHHAGLSEILIRRLKLLSGVPHEPLLVIGPLQLKTYLDHFQLIEDLDIHFLDCRHTTEASWTAFEDSTVELSLKKLKKVVEEAGLEALVSVPVVHQAFGVVVKAGERKNILGKTIPGWKLVYSGDTRPCLELINASRGATVLIHEATFENDKLEDAIAKNHSTTNEAIEVGDSAGAYRIILTHFSQRYPKSQFLMGPTCTKHVLLLT